MFTIEHKSEQGFAKIILKDNPGKAFVEIIPSCGAILYSFNVWYGNRFLNIIDNYSDAEDFKNHVSDKGFKSCKLSPYACRVYNAVYRFEGRDYKLEKFLLNESALHGFIYDAPFETIHESSDETGATVILKYAYQGNEKGFPFPYDCLVTYQLQDENKLNISTEIINRGNTAMPLQDGWHPYFTFGGKINDLQLKFQAQEKMEFNDKLIPTGKFLPYDFFSFKKIANEKFDDCFVLDFSENGPACVLRDDAQKIQLEITPDKTYPYLQIYTPDHRDSIAIENLSAPPDTFNNAISLIVLAAGESACFQTSFKITSLI